MIGQSSGRDHANDLPVWAQFADVPDSRLSGDPIQPGSAAVGEQVPKAGLRMPAEDGRTAAISDIERFDCTARNLTFAP